MQELSHSNWRNVRTNRLLGSAPAIHPPMAWVMNGRPTWLQSYCLSGNSINNRPCKTSILISILDYYKMETSNLRVNVDQERLERVRPCGRLETYSTARHYLSFYNNVGLTATYTSSFKHQFALEKLVYLALHHVIAHHPNLSAIPINECNSYPNVYFGRLPEIDLRTCVEFITRKKPIPQGDETDQELDEILRGQHNTGFKTESGLRPYWRLIITSSPKTSGIFSAS